MFVRIRRRVQTERGKAVRQFRGPDQVLTTQNLLGSEVVYCETGSLSDFKRSEIRWEEAAIPGKHKTLKSLQAGKSTEGQTSK